MSRTTCPADHDDRTPVTVMLSPAQLMRIELYLAQVRETHPGADDNAITDLIFARGLDAVMEEATMQQDTPDDAEKACRRAYDNRYHKIPAAIGYDQWRDIWLDAMDHARTTRPLDYTAVLSKGDIAGGRFLQLGIGRKLADLLARTHKACHEKSPDYSEDSLLRHALECGLCDIAAGIRDLQEYPRAVTEDALATTAETDITPDGLVRHALYMPIELHPMTQDLVRNFAEALANRLKVAESNDDWADSMGEWPQIDVPELQVDLMQRVTKGNPLDVAAFCAFLWRIKQPTAPVGCVTEERHKADMAHWRSDCERLTQQLEAARCRSIPDACAVLQDAVSGAGCCIHIDDSASVEVMFGEDDSIYCLPSDLPDVLEALSVIESHRPIPVRVTDAEG